MKTIHSIGEFGLIREISKWVPGGAGVIRGIGDDAAVLNVKGKGYQLLTVDSMVEGVDFSRREATPEQIGRKALAINLSDIAAMGGVPKAAVVSLILPTNTNLVFAKRFYQGLLRLARRYAVAIVGGDLSRGPVIMCTIAVLGETLNRRAVFRTGARIGDYVCVTGKLGGSILGKHLKFTPRLREGQFLSKHGVSSMIDISDGLLQDLQHLTEKPGLTLMIADRDIPIDPAAFRLAHRNRAKALMHALRDGEDFELLFTVAPAKFRRLTQLWPRRFSVPLTAIGRVVEGRKARAHEFKRLGFQHF